MLRKIRIVVSVVLLSLITFFFIDFAELTPNHGFLTRIQLIPALLALNVGVLIALFLLTFLFGRVYCSFICPLGIWQDVVEWFSKRGKKKKKYKYNYLKPRNILRYSLLAVVTVAFLSGMTFILGLLDPYSMYARISVNLFKPVYLALNNLLATILESFNNYSLYFMEVTIRSGISFVVALVSLLAVSWLAYKYGRLYCNTICPVGSLLGIISRYSLFKIRMNEESCNQCGLCEKVCKASCIDAKNKTVDTSRCVTCFNCIDTCNRNSIKYTYPHSLKAEVEAEKANETNEGRRTFLLAAGTGLLSAPLAKAQEVTAKLSNNVTYKKQHPISPPGSKSAEHLLKHCTSCHLCVSRCPVDILKPAFMEYGLGGIMQPHMSFEKGFCNFDCTICADVCPNGALLPLTMEEKHKLQVGKVVFVLENCIPYTDGTSCGACSEHCPTQAVSMKPYKDGLTLPSVDPDICVGCGGCEFICPVRPYRAIYIEGNPVHQEAKPFEEAEIIEDAPDGFGF